MMTTITIRGAEPAPSLWTAVDHTGSELRDVRRDAPHLTRLFWG
jgi:hypothetical protein